MEITKESFLKAEDPKNRDAMLFDMLSGISSQIHKCNKIKTEVERCRSDITIINRIGGALATIFGILGIWLGLK